MSERISLQAFGRPRSWRLAVPGVALALTLALAAKLASERLGDWFLEGAATPVSPVLCAVLLGIAWRNFVGVGRREAHGLQWATQALLRIGIALIGLRLTLQGLTAIGATALPVVVGGILVALGVSHVIGKALGITQPLRHLIAVGTAVCGCTAIVATTPVARARPAETGLAISCIVLFGCLAMVSYPWLAHHLFGGNAALAGIFLGTSIHDTSQVIGASLIFSQQFGASDVVAAASATKLLRNLSILVLVPLIAYWAAREERRVAEPSTTGRIRAVPAFVIWFMGLVLARSLGDGLFAGSEAATEWWARVVGTAQTLSEVMLVCGMTAVGLTISFQQLREVGWRPLVVALTVAVSVAASSLGLTLAAQHLAL